MKHVQVGRGKGLGSVPHEDQGLLQEDLHPSVVPLPRPFPGEPLSYKLRRRVSIKICCEGTMHFNR